MRDHESDGLEYQDDEEEEEEDEELVRDLTGGGALAAVQPPAASAVPGLRNAPIECTIRMPRLGQRGQHGGVRTYYASHRPRAGFDAFL